MNQPVKHRIKETLSWEFPGLLQHIGFIPLHEPQNLILIEMAYEANICSLYVNISGSKFISY